MCGGVGERIVQGKVWAMRVQSLTRIVGDGPAAGLPVVGIHTNFLASEMSIETICRYARAHNVPFAMISGSNGSKYTLEEKELPEVILALKAEYGTTPGNTHFGMLVGVEIDGKEYSEAVSLHADAVVIDVRDGKEVPEEALEYLRDRKSSGRGIAVKYRVHNREYADQSIRYMEEFFSVCCKDNGGPTSRVDFVLETYSRADELVAHRALSSWYERSDPRHILPLIRSVPKGIILPPSE